MVQFKVNPVAASKELKSASATTLLDPTSIQPMAFVLLNRPSVEAKLLSAKQIYALAAVPLAAPKAVFPLLIVDAEALFPKEAIINPVGVKPNPVVALVPVVVFSVSEPTA